MNSSPSVLSVAAQKLVEYNDWELRAHAVLAAHDSSEPQLLTLLEAYLLTASAQALRTSPRTLQAYQAAARFYLRWAAEQGLPLLSPARRDGHRYLQHLQTVPAQRRAPGTLLTRATVSQYLAGVRALYRALRWADATQTTFLDDLRSPGDPTPGIVKNPPYPDLEPVLIHCDDRLAALLLLCAHSGLRINEALQIKVQDLNGALLTVQGKGSRQRRVPLSRRCRERIARLQPGADGRYFSWTYRQAAYRMGRAFTQTGLSWRGFHAARKAAGTRLYAQTADFTRVAIFLGHASTDTTRRYVALRQHDLTAVIDDW